LADGQAFGKVDPNNKKGMPIDKAVTNILKSITLGVAEQSIGSMFYGKVLYPLYNTLP